MRIIGYFITGFALVAMLAISGCATGEMIPPPHNNYGTVVSSAYDGGPVTIGPDTQALKYNGRSYYFAKKNGLNSFRDNPQYYIARFPYNELPKATLPLKADFGLTTECAYNGNITVIGTYTPTAFFAGRIYYFEHFQQLNAFIQDPQIYLAKFSANDIPKIIESQKLQYGKEAVCAATGVPLLISSQTPSLLYDSQIYYFSSREQLQAFKADPLAYVAKRFNLK